MKWNSTARSRRERDLYHTSQRDGHRGWGGAELLNADTRRREKDRRTRWESGEGGETEQAARARNGHCFLRRAHTHTFTTTRHTYIYTTHIYTYINTQTHIHIRIHIHTYAHTQTHTQPNTTHAHNHTKGTSQDSSISSVFRWATRSRVTQKK